MTVRPLLPCLALLLWSLLLIGCQFNQSALDAQRCDPLAEDPGCEAGQACSTDGYCHVVDASTADVVEANNCGASPCAAGQACCEEACADLDSDPAHCGACGAACADGMVCRDGACACDTERADCDENPSNGCEVRLTGYDPSNCGACGNACPDNMACIAGSCICQPGRVDCDQDLDELPAGGSNGCEIDILSDAHCGGCETTRECEPGEVCDQGRCYCGNGVCVEGQSCCEGACIDTAISQANCGACGIACAQGLVCSGGQCVCPANANQACAESQSCCPDGCVAGACPTCGGVDCADDQLCCDETCVPSLTDTANCGACGNACGTDQTCEGGTCVCVGGGEFCPTAGACVDTGVDEAHCGACGNACAAGESCCDGQCVDTNTSLTQCGACLADGGQQCVAGQGCCGGSCVNLSSVASCGACGNDCEDAPYVDDARCDNQTCVIESCNWWDWYEDCNADPADGCEHEVRSDPNNCGGCGRVCNGACVDGLCVCDDGTCGYGATCLNGQCRCGNDADRCRYPEDGSHCEGNSCRCGGEGSCGGSDICEYSYFWGVFYCD